eukprot:8746853-Prorocentrum_lima.AAC.1
MCFAMWLPLHPPIEILCALIWLHDPISRRNTGLLVLAPPTSSSLGDLDVVLPSPGLSTAP